MQTPKKTVRAAAASMPTQKTSTTGSIPKAKTPVNSPAITPKQKPKTVGYIKEYFLEKPINKAMGRDIPLPDSSSLF